MDLRSESKDEGWAKTLTESGWQEVELNDRQGVICTYADKLTRTPAAMTAQDIEDLRHAGLRDKDILDVVQATSYFNYINRVADALHVPNEPEWD